MSLKEDNIASNPPKMQLYRAHYVKKGWGYELWPVNLDYCGKILFVERGKKFSWHKHEIKDETFMLFDGMLHLRYGEDESFENCTEVIMQPGDCFHVFTGLWHQVEGIENSHLIEFSTTHRDDDSIRGIKGD